MINNDEDLIYFAQKVKNAKSTAAKLKALRQLEMMLQGHKIALEAQLKQERNS